jgi:YfiR/HmsC-like
MGRAVHLAGILVFATLLVVHTRATAAEKVSDYEVKAAYIYNFARFVEWPPEGFPDATAPVRFCILNNHSFEIELNRIVKGKSISGRRIDVIQVLDGEQARKCHVLFIGSSQNRETRHILEALQGANVLTVGESNHFMEEGGIINFVLKNDSVQFQINHKAANQAGLYISSRLLSVAARIVE